MKKEKVHRIVLHDATFCSISFAENSEETDLNVVCSAARATSGFSRTFSSMLWVSAILYSLQKLNFEYMLNLKQSMSRSTIRKIFHFEEGKEGKPLGTIFILGDDKKVLEFEKAGKE